MAGEKPCRTCGSTRKYSTLDPRFKAGIRWRCTDCAYRRAKKWAKENREKRLECERRWNAKQSERLKRERWLLKLEVFMNLGGKCLCCREDDLRFLTVDHINRGGAAHRRAVGGSTLRVYNDIKKRGYPKDEFQLLCWNCHMATRYGDPCPHTELGAANA